MREQHLAVRGLVAVEFGRGVVAMQPHRVEVRGQVVAVVLEPLVERLGEQLQLLVEYSK